MKTQKATNRRGATAVEFAFVFPVILFLFFSSVVSFQAFLLRDTAQYAAYEGARESLLSDATVENVEKKVRETLRIFHVREADIDIDPKSINESTQEVTVYVDIPFHENAWLAPGFVPKRWNLGASVTLRRH